MYAEDDLLPISALQHLMFCERQWALIHLEGVWEENRLTAEGRVMHDRVHEVDSESRGDVRIARGLRVRSLRLGITGQCDVVEFRKVPANTNHGDTESTGEENAGIEDRDLRVEISNHGDTESTGEENAEIGDRNLRVEISNHGDTKSTEEENAEFRDENLSRKILKNEIATDAPGEESGSELLNSREILHHGDAASTGEQIAYSGIPKFEFDEPLETQAPRNRKAKPKSRLQNPKCWVPFPIEYKRGKPKPDFCDEVQLCAQALCLEEMLGAAAPEGALFYGKTRRRHGVAFDAALRGRTEQLIQRLHALHRAGVTPAVAYEKKCDNCSLINLCLPKCTGGTRSATRYLARAVREQQAESTAE